MGITYGFTSLEFDTWNNTKVYKRSYLRGQCNDTVAIGINLD